MWTIRQEQAEAFRQSALQKFEDEMVPLLQKLFPQTAQKLGEAGLRDVIRHGINRAREYDIVRQQDVGRYIALMMLLGPDFDRRITSGPVHAVLRDPCLQNSEVRTDALCNAALSALKRRTARTGRQPCW
jgi:hypothetical protein